MNILFYFVKQLGSERLLNRNKLIIRWNSTIIQEIKVLGKFTSYFVNIWSDPGKTVLAQRVRFLCSSEFHWYRPLLPNYPSWKVYSERGICSRQFVAVFHNRIERGDSSCHHSGDDCPDTFELGTKALQRTLQSPGRDSTLLGSTAKCLAPFSALKC